MLDSTRRRIESVQAATRANVDASPLVFGNARNLIARQALGCRVRNETRVLCCRIVYAGKAALVCSNPERPALVKIESPNHPYGQTISRSQHREPAIRVAREGILI